MQPDWEIWLDNQFSPIIAKWIYEQTGVICKSAYILNLRTNSDFAIYEIAKAAGKIIIISKDSDIPQIIISKGAPPKLIYVRRGNCHNKIMFQLILDHLDYCLKMLLEFDYDIVEIQ